MCPHPYFLPGPKLSPLSPSPSPSIPFPSPLPTPLPCRLDTAPTLPRRLGAFPSDGAKHCYALPVATRACYLVRATFLYAGFDGDDAFPEFNLYLGATRWSPVVVYDGARLVIREAIVLAQSSIVSVCLSNATTGRPFISTLELRPLNGSLYHTDAEARAFLALAARINFGAPSPDPVRSVFPFPNSFSSSPDDDDLKM